VDLVIGEYAAIIIIYSSGYRMLRVTLYHTEGPPSRLWVTEEATDKGRYHVVWEISISSFDQR